jgi:Fe-S-cluster containining protein
MGSVSTAGAADRKLVQIVDAAAAEAVRRSGPRVACRPGCSDCCLGPFPISGLDALRLRSGMQELEKIDPGRALRIRERAARVSRDGQSDDDPCPALDPETRLCELYEFRPITCRVFGPPLRSGDGPVGVCELCFEGAAEEEIAACAVEIDTGALEEEALREMGGPAAAGEELLVAEALLA